MEPVPFLEISPMEWLHDASDTSEKTIQEEYKTIKIWKWSERVLGLTPLLNSSEWSTEREQSACFELFHQELHVFDIVWAYIIYIHAPYINK